MERGIDIKLKEGNIKLFLNNQLIGMGIRDGGILRMKFKTIWPAEVNAPEGESLKLVHEKLGHASIETIKKMPENGTIANLKLSDKTKFFCEACEYGKQASVCHRSVTIPRKTEPGEMVHSDVCGRFSVEGLGGKYYFLLLKDDATEYRVVFPLRNKEEVAEKVIQYLNLVRNKFGRELQVFRSDNGREFVNSTLLNQFKQRGITFETTAPHTPQQNGKAERENRTLVESMRSMIYGRHCLKFLWPEAVLMAAQVWNRVTTEKSNKTPFEHWHGRKPNMKNLHVFGSKCMAQIPKISRKKLDKKAVPMIFVGYKDDSNNYKVFNPESRKLQIASTVSFDEIEAGNFEFEFEHSTVEIENSNELVVKIKDDAKKPDNNNPEAQHLEDQQHEDTQEELQDKRNDRTSSELDESSTSYQQKVLRDRTKIKRPDRYSNGAYVAIVEPRTYQEALNGPDAKKWEAAILEEIDAHNKNKTWFKSDIPKDRKPISCRWVFKVKHVPGEKDRFKARIVARGFTQCEGVDYEETYAPVVRYDTCRVLFAKVAMEDLEMIQFDVKTAFLHGELREDIWIILPDGSWPDTERLMKLSKSLYGLKQSPNCWNRKFDSLLHRDLKWSAHHPMIVSI